MAGLPNLQGRSHATSPALSRPRTFGSGNRTRFTAQVAFVHTGVVHTKSLRNVVGENKLWQWNNRESFFACSTKFAREEKLPLPSPAVQLLVPESKSARIVISPGHPPPNTAHRTSTSTGPCFSNFLFGRKFPLNKF